MRKIVAIGGGSLQAKETLEIDKEIVKLTGKERPKALFIPTASGDDENYCATFKEVYGQQLGCEVDTLLLLKDTLSYEEIAVKILSADLIYVGGGNTLMMMRKWRFLGVNELLKKARDSGKVLAGVSAGALCWFEYGHSDSMSYYKAGEAGKDWEYIRVKCLGFVDRITLCPHYHGENRDEHFQDMIKKMGGIGIALDDNCALQIVDNKYRVISTKHGANAYKVYKTRAKTIEKVLYTNQTWNDISKLRSKLI